MLDEAVGKAHQLAIDVDATKHVQHHAMEIDATKHVQHHTTENDEKEGAKSRNIEASGSKHLLNLISAMAYTHQNTDQPSLGRAGCSLKRPRPLPAMHSTQTTGVTGMS